METSELAVGVAFLSVVVAAYSIRAASKREHVRWKRERRDRRRERLAGLYSDWSSRVMDLLARQVQAHGVGMLATERADAISGSDTMALLERVFVAQREVNRAAIAIALEEGDALATDVETLSRAATSWDGEAPQTIQMDLERLLQAKRVSLAASK